MNIIKRLMVQSLVSLFVLCFSMTTAGAQPLNLAYHQGDEPKYKPSLSQRISGARKIYVFYPKNAGQNDRFIYENIAVH